MTDYTHNDLVAKVKAVNMANAYANELLAKLTEFFRPYVGKDILKNDGSLLAKIKGAMPDFPSDNDMSVYFHTSPYSLAWTVITCVSSPRQEDYSIAVYHETTVYIGDIQGKTLTKLCESYQDKPDFRSDYTVEEVLRDREEAKVAKEAYDKAKGKLYLFGE